MKRGWGDTLQFIGAPQWPFSAPSSSAGAFLLSLCSVPQPGRKLRAGRDSGHDKTHVLVVDRAGSPERGRVLSRVTEQAHC